MISMTTIRSEQALEMVFNSLGDLRRHFDDPLVQEVMINGPDDVFVEKGGRMIKLDIKLSSLEITAAITVLANSAGKTVKANTENCILNERWSGVRVCATLPPVSLNGPTMAIRKHSSVKFTLDDMVTTGALDQATKDALRLIIINRKNILVVGGTSSGKTTFLKALIREIDPEDRVITIEDLPELDIEIPNRVAFETREDYNIRYTDLVKVGLRYNPTRFILGEVRDGAALDLLNAANTGHDGCIATLHANSSYEGLVRFEDLVMQAGSRIPLLSIQRRIATTFHYVVFMGKVGGKRKLMELLKLEGFDANEGQYHFTHIFREQRHEIF
jgi:pilus assembly protein CpaF